MKRLILSSALMVFVAVICNNAFAYDFSAVCESGQTLYYNITSSTEVEVTNENNGSYNSYNTYPTGDLIIPSSVAYNGGTYSVTSIGNKAFYSCVGLTGTLSIPNSVTLIGELAFHYCHGLTSLIIPESLERIKNDAFQGCTFESLEYNAINCTVDYSDGGLSHNPYLTTITIGQGVTTFPIKYLEGLTAVYYYGSIDDWCRIRFFDACSNPVFYAHNLYINGVLLTNLVIPESITQIKPYSFSGADCITSVTFHNSVTTIGTYAFDKCNGFDTLTIPSSVTAIGEGAFYDCRGLTTVNFNAINCGTPRGKSVFYGCTSFVTLNIGDCVTNIPTYAFHACLGLTEITIPNSVTDIGEWAFSFCQGLTSFIIGNSVANIENYAFAGCGNVDTIYSLAINPPTIFPNTFDSLNLDIPVLVHCGTAENYESEEYWSSFTNIQGNQANQLYLESANPEMGVAYVIEAPDCENTEAIIEAVANEGYAFIGWNDGNTDNPRTITVTGDITFVANFASSSSDIQAKFYTDSNATAEAGSSMTILATEDFVVYPIIFNAGPDEAADTLTVDLLINGDSMLAGGAQSISLASQPLPVNRPVIIFPDDGALAFSADQMDSYGLFGTIELCFIANYSGNDPNTENNTVCITVTRQQQHTITVLANNEEYGTVTGGGTYDYGTEIQISAIASEHCHFVQWSDGITDNPRTVVVEGDTTYTALFAIDQHTITVLSDDENLGSVSEGGTYNYGTEIQISATASEGYAFLSWNDGNTENPRTIEVISDTTYIATFAIARTVTIESSNTDMGYVIGSGVYAEGAEVEITAVPYEGYRFDHWVDVDNPSRDFNTDNPRTIVVSTDVTYMAVFTDVVGIEDNGVPAISVFPNPTTNILNITSSETIAEIEFVNVMGQVVKRMEVNADNVVCDVNELKAGVYIVRISTASATLSQQRLIKK